MVDCPDALSSLDRTYADVKHPLKLEKLNGEFIFFSDPLSDAHRSLGGHVYGDPGQIADQ